VEKFGEETIHQILNELGLTQKEIEVYIFLAKHGVLKSREVAIQIRKDKAQVLRILKSLQSKSMVESSLQTPKRFSAVPLEKALDEFVKSKREEATLIEKAKKDLLAFWKTSSKTMAEVPMEKFVVLEGNKIYSKISQMISETNKQILGIATAADLIRAEKKGIFESISNNPLRTKIQIRFVTNITNQNSNEVKRILEKASKTGINLRGKEPILSQKLFPRLLVRDEEEALLFITSEQDMLRNNQIETGIWTDCKTLVKMFTSIIEDFWLKSAEKLKDIPKNTNSYPPKTLTVYTAEKGQKKSEQAINSAKKEITILTSSKGLIDLAAKIDKAREQSLKGIRIRIMAPTTANNLEAIQQLSKYCEVRHCLGSWVNVVLVDDKYLFQTGNDQLEDVAEKNSERAYTLFTSDHDYISGVKLLLDDEWEKAQTPSNITLSSILRPQENVNDPFGKPKSLNPYFRGTIVIQEHKKEIRAEKDLLNKILAAKKIRANDPVKDINTLCGSSASAVIHPPSNFGLPDMMLTIWHCDKQSSWGAEDWLSVSLWIETPRGLRYVAVAHITDNPGALEFRKGVWANTPAAENCQLVNKDQFRVQVHNNTLFAGWTMPIQLLPKRYILPPSCLLIEGYGEVKTVITKTSTPSGRTQVLEANAMDAFVTFFHPSSKYSGPGTDGIFNREAFLTAYPPSSALEK
jgi:sugar-specific transcriptional regulator TrmB